MTAERPPPAFDDNDQKPASAGCCARRTRASSAAGPLRRRRPAARHAAPGDPALARRARPDRLVDTSAAEAHPKVKAGGHRRDAGREAGLAWMPTLSNDVQAVLATDKVRFQGQEVAFVVAEDRYAARTRSS
jgi:carbon-monoxide dehydrogenase large subunit